MVKFKATDVKSVGKVQVSAKRLRELADKLEKVRGTDGNEEIDVYIVPGSDKAEASQLAFDFVRKEEVKAEAPKEETKTEVPQTETKETETKETEAKETPAEKKEETEVREEAKPEDKTETKAEKPAAEEQPTTAKAPETTETAAEPPKEQAQSEVERINKGENIARKAEEIKEKAYKKDSE